MVFGLNWRRVFDRVRKKPLKRIGTRTRRRVKSNVETQHSTFDRPGVLPIPPGRAFINENLAFVTPTAYMRRGIPKGDNLWRA